ncbi:NAD(P)H-hydrate dehydratase, partial [Neobacillus citreus]
VHEIIPQLQQFDCVAIGPGMGRFTGGEEWLKLLIGSMNGQVLIIDADGLYFIRSLMDLVRQYKGPVVFTPHPGEMARLVNKSVKEVEENRIDIAREYAKESHVFLLLKGHRSIIVSPDGQVYINPLGHDALGKGGSGDVLTGLIASFLAQGAEPLHAMIAASYLHARAGQEKAKVLSHYGVMPLDIIEGIKEQLK